MQLNEIGSGIPLKEVTNAGLVRPAQGLGLSPDWIDCPTCNKRQMTKIEKVPSEHTKLWTYFFFYIGIPFCCCCTYPIPKKRKMCFDVVHYCSGEIAPGQPCNHQIALVQHNKAPSNANYVQSAHIK